ncbi:hypothetical protein QYF61_020071 [Mycteria americana]|uniref:Uncharacterized protein n=1 Tax=Mycteria americana TaxID=33587 RepID=A0AAN7RVQ0_MYCAM|nr:hypothetical protein QYF61_020071 [Mycteria americana]
MGNKQDELEPLGSSQSYSIIGISEAWWNESHDWSTGMEGYRLFRRDGQGRRGGGVALYVRERFDCTALAVSDDVVESLWVRIRGIENKGDIVVGVYYRSPSQAVSTDELSYRQLGEISGLGALVLMGYFNFPDMMIMASWVQPDLDCSPLLLELLKAVVLGVLVAVLTAAQKYKCMVKWAERDASESLQDLVKSLQVELEAEQKKRVRLEIAATRLQNQLHNAFVRECELWLELEEARREDLESECGRCGLSKEREMADRGVAGHYPWEEMEQAKCQHERTAPQLCPLIKTEFQYEGGADTAPEIITKEIPYSATELAKLQDRYSRVPRETETEYVWRVSLTGGDRIKLSEEEAQGYWGPGVFLTVPDTRAPWSLTQRAGGLDPLERGDPVTIPTPGLDQITESVQKAACLQLVHGRHLTPHQPSPTLLKADPSRMKPLIKGLPDPLKLHAIQIQDRLRAALPIQERLTEMLTPRRSQTQSTPANSPSPGEGLRRS